MVELQGAIVPGTVCDVSRAGVGIRADLPPARDPRIVVRFWAGGKSFRIPGDLVWTGGRSTDCATLGVRLAVRRARPTAREAFRHWTSDVARSRTGPGALPAREQVECRLAALLGELNQLLELLDGASPLDAPALAAIDAAAEELQNAITQLQLRSRA